MLQRDFPDTNYHPSYYGTTLNLMPGASYIFQRKGAYLVNGITEAGQRFGNFSPFRNSVGSR